MSQATGWSANFDLGEALKDAVRKLPSEDTDSPLGYTVIVTKIEGNFTRGIVPPHLEVTVQTGRYDQQSTERRIDMTNGATPAATEPNDFTLEGQNKQIHFSATTFPGVPFLSYKDEEEEGNNRDFRGNQIDILETPFGKLVTVLLQQVPDSHVVYLTLLLPTIYLPEDAREFPVETIGILTTHKTPFTGPGGNVNGLQVDTYDTLNLKGTARLIIT